MRRLLLPLPLLAALGACAGAPTVPPAPGVDAFGTPALHAVRRGGLTWASTAWGNGHVRAFSGVDPDDPWFDAGHGAGRCEVDGKGRLTASGDTVRLYVHDPARRRAWGDDLEITGWVTRLGETRRVDYSGPQIFARTNHGTWTGGRGGEERTLCDDRGLGAKLNLDGTAAFEKECRHGGARGYATAAPVKALADGFAVGKPLGIKFIVRNRADGPPVHLKLWLDRGEGWRLATQAEDQGAWGRGYDACAPGVDPALPLTRENLRGASESGRPTLSVYFRHEYGSMAWERVSIREIDPLPRGPEGPLRP